MGLKKYGLYVPFVTRSVFVFFLSVFLSFGFASVQVVHADEGSGKKVHVSATFEKVRHRGRLHCGVAAGLSGFAWQAEGKWQGLDVDFCRAIAAVVLGDAQKVRFVPTTTSDRFDLLRSRDIDVLLRSTAWTASRDLASDLRFVGVTYFNGLTHMVQDGGRIENLSDLDGQSICLSSGEAVETTLLRVLNQKGASPSLIRFETSEDAQQAYEAGRCQAILGEAFTLALRRSFLNAPSKHRLLKQYISIEPLGPVVLQADAVWGDLISHLMNTLVAAEERGIDQDLAMQKLQNVKDGSSSFSNAAQHFNEEQVTAIAAVGHYGEIYQRNFMSLQWERGPNQPWTEGGLMFSPSGQ